MFRKKVLFVFLFTVPFFAYSEEHHNLSISGCRALATGDIQVTGTSSSDSQKRSIMLLNSKFQEKILDRYLSLCLASQASSSLLRVSYLNCVGTSCTTTGSTSLEVQN
tara:strand:- start:13381 stop:13704 length:324 start_codon:yes stop_codon:yes gene_type:complete